MEKRIEELYQQYLSGQLSQSDFEQLQRKVVQTSDEDLWNLMCGEFSSSASSAKMEDASQQRILQQLQQQIRRSQRWQLVRRLLRRASVVILLVSVLSGSIWWLRSQHAKTPIYTYVSVKAGSKSTITLPDGTHVSLNGNSQLRYHVVPEEQREVELLRGEAYFDVTKDANCPFHVRVNDMQIEVLGTRFNVRCHEGVVETALFSGAVQLSAAGLSQVYQLVPGRKSVYSVVNHQMNICDNDSTTDARWKDGYLAFSSQPLSEVLQEIENWYGVTIELRNQKLADDLLTGAFYHETLESVLYSLSLQYKFKYQIKHNHILIE